MRWVYVFAHWPDDDALVGNLYHGDGGRVNTTRSLGKWMEWLFIIHLLVHRIQFSLFHFVLIGEKSS